VLCGELRAACGDWVTWLAQLPLEAFYRSRLYGGHDWRFATVPLPGRWAHDAHHAARIARWRETAAGLAGKSGPKAVLRAALAAARDELLAAIALLREPVEARATRPVCGHWTLQDVVGHLADWERLGAEGLRQMAAGRAPRVEHVADVDAWNAAHVQARQGQPWEVAWGDLVAARQALLSALGEMGEGDLGRTYPFPWGPEGTPYQWVAVYAQHDRSHARGLRGAGTYVKAGQA
jgi:hypothetical protein